MAEFLFLCRNLHSSITSVEFSGKIPATCMCYTRIVAAAVWRVVVFAIAIERFSLEKLLYFRHLCSYLHFFSRIGDSVVK